MKKKKLLVIFIILALFIYGIYTVFPYYIDWAIRTDLARYDKEVSSYYATLDRLKVHNYTDGFIPVAYGSIRFGEGIIAINEQGEYRRFIDPFKYYNHVWKLYYNNEELWIFPGYYSTIMYIYDVPWIYIVNTRTGKINEKIFTNTSSNAVGYCVHNNKMHILFQNTGRTSSYLYLENREIKNKTKLKRGQGGLVTDYTCTQKGIASNHFGEILFYNFSATNNVSFLGNITSPVMTYDGENTIYYSNMINESRDMISYDIKTGNRKKMDINSSIYLGDFEYIHGDIFAVDQEINKLYRYEFPSFRLKETVKINSSDVIQFHKFGENRYILGSSIITIHSDKIEVLNTSLPPLEAITLIK